MWKFVLFGEISFGFDAFDPMDFPTNAKYPQEGLLSARHSNSQTMVA